MEIKVTLEIGISEDAKNFIAGLLQAKPAKVTAKKAPVKETPAEEHKEAIEAKEEPKEETPAQEPGATATAVQAREAINAARTRGVETDTIKSLLPKYGVEKVSDLTPEDTAKFIKEVEAL